MRSWQKRSRWRESSLADPLLRGRTGACRPRFSAEVAGTVVVGAERNGAGRNRRLACGWPDQRDKAGPHWPQLWKPECRWNIDIFGGRTANQAQACMAQCGHGVGYYRPRTGRRLSGLFRAFLYALFRGGCRPGRRVRAAGRRAFQRDASWCLTIGHGGKSARCKANRTSCAWHALHGLANRGFIEKVTPRLRASVT